MQRTKRSRAWGGFDDENWWYESQPEIARIVIDRDEDPGYTGLLDQYGTPILRPREKIKFGSCHEASLRV